MIGSRWCRIGVRSLLLTALLFGIGAQDGSAQLFSLEVGYRGRSSGPSYSFRPPAGPFFGLRFAPPTSGWASLGVDAFWVPSVTDAIIPEYCTSMLSTGECVKRVDTTSESATQAGLSVRLGQLRHRGVFGEIGVGLYRLTQKGRNEFWASSDADYGERWHRNSLIDSYDTGPYSEAGGYARIGVGVQLRLRDRGPTLLTSLRYRWASTVGEGSFERNGLEIMLGLGVL